MPNGLANIFKSNSLSWNQLCLADISTWGVNRNQWKLNRVGRLRYQKRYSPSNSLYFHSLFITLVADVDPNKVLLPPYVA